MRDAPGVSMVCWDVLGAAAVLRLGAGVQSGGHDGSRLRRAGAIHLLADLSGLPGLVASAA